MTIWINGVSSHFFSGCPTQSGGEKEEGEKEETGAESILRAARESIEETPLKSYPRNIRKCLLLFFLSKYANIKRFHLGYVKLQAAFLHVFFN